MSTQHTPTPWKVFTSPDGLKVVGIGSLEGEGICDAGFGIWRWNDAEGLANAELIVRAVNSHDEMLAALRSIMTNVSPGGFDDLRRLDEGQIVRIRDVARAAIAKAESRS